MTQDNTNKDKEIPQKIKKTKKPRKNKAAPPPENNEIVITKKDEENLFELGQILEEWAEEQKEFEEDGESPQFDIKNFELLVGRLKEIKLILIDMGVEENAATVIVDNLVFLVPPEFLSSGSFDVLINNYCEYIKVVYDFCKERDYPLFLMIELVNDFTFIVDGLNEMQLIRYIKIDLPIEIAKIQLKIRDEILNHFLLKIPSNDAYAILGKLDILVLPVIYEALCKEKEKDGKSVMSHIIKEFSESIIKLHELYVKELGAGARAISTANMNSLVIVDDFDEKE